MKKNRLPYSKNPGYKVPLGYFTQLEEEILARVTEPSTSILSKEPTRPFRTPEAYFEGLEQQILKKIEGDKQASRVIPLFRKSSFYYTAGVAAVFIAFLVTLPLAQPEPMSLSDLDMVTLESYLEESFDETSPEVSRIYSEEFDAFSPITGSRLDQEAVMEYLQENLEDLSVIINSH